MIRIWFCRSDDIGGFLIRLFTWSKWNHVAIEVNGYVYEAVSGGGVRRIKARAYPHVWSQSTPVNLWVRNHAAAETFLKLQVGKPYDWLALLSWPIRSTWQSPHRWFCSELAAKALRHAGYTYIGEKAHRVTPEDLWEALGAEPEPNHPAGSIA